MQIKHYVVAIFWFMILGTIALLINGCSGKGYPLYDECQKQKIQIANMTKGMQYSECKQ